MTYADLLAKLGEHGYGQPVPYDLNKHPFYDIPPTRPRPERVFPHVQGAALARDYDIVAAGAIERCYAEWAP